MMINIIMRYQYCRKHRLELAQYSSILELQGQVKRQRFHSNKKGAGARGGEGAKLRFQWR